MNTKNKGCRNRLSYSYVVFLSSVILLASFSILNFNGKLQIFAKIKENGYTAADISNLSTTGSIRLNTTVNSTLDTSTAINFKKVSAEQKGKATTTNDNRQKTKFLEVAWLMSFPNSGTTYTNHLIQDYTNTTTATNYGQEQSPKNDSVPIFSDSKDGPFFRYPSWLLPPQFILTKTHCGGECDACQDTGSKRYIDTIDAFEKACCTGKRIFNKTKIQTTYSSNVPKRAVHLIRDPFDNIVARLHLKERHWERHHNDTKYKERVDLFNRTKEGFQAYCKFRDINSFKQEFRQRNLSNELLEYAKRIPCYAEFIRYTRWHNNAIQLLAKKSIPVLTIFYEDYALDWDSTVNKLLKFLSLHPAPGATAEEFILGKHYNEFFSQEEKTAAINLMKALASTELWNLLLRRYFS